MSLFIELRKQGKLAAKRNPMYEKNKLVSSGCTLWPSFGPAI